MLTTLSSMAAGVSDQADIHGGLSEALALSSLSLLDLLRW